MFITDPNGGVYMATGSPYGDWGTWTLVDPVSGFRSALGTRVTAVPWTKRLALFVSDAHGGIYATAGDCHFEDQMA